MSRAAGEFLNGFPTTLEELAPFRVVVLSNLRPADLRPLNRRSWPDFAVRWAAAC